MESSTKYLHTRADGLTETPAGDVAVIMVKRSGLMANGDNYFTFVFSLTSDPVTAQWTQGEKLQIFPQAIAEGMIARGWAVHPNAEAIEWFEDTLVAGYAAAEKLAEKPEPEPEPAPAPAPPPAPSANTEAVPEPDKIAPAFAAPATPAPAFQPAPSVPVDKG